MALYKGNRDDRQGKSTERRSALHRSQPEQPPAQWSPPPQPQAEGAPSETVEGTPLPPIPPPRPEADFSHTQIAGDSGEGRVFGKARALPTRPEHLPAYEQTIVIGGDPKREDPPPPPESPMSDDSGQEMAAPPAAPAPPAIDREILEKAQEQAQQLLHQAQVQAQQVEQQAIAQAAEAAEVAKQQALQQGYQEGLQAGQQAGLEASAVEAQERLDLLKSEFVSLVKARRKVLAEFEPQLIQLCLDIAERIVATELKQNRESIVSIVREGIATLKEREEITIRLNPQEVQVLKPFHEELESMVEGLKRFNVQGDGSIEPGSCVIETNLGNVDARVATRLEAVRLGLEEISKIRSFEKKEQLELKPVEVPGDPEFAARQRQGQQQTGDEAGHAGAGQPEAEHAGAGSEGASVTESPQDPPSEGVEPDA